MKEEPMVKNASDRSQVKNASEEMKRRKNREDEDLRRVLSTNEGAAVIWRILERCNTFSSVIVEDKALLTYYKAGKQDVGHWLLGEVSRVNEISMAKAMLSRYKKSKENK